MDARPVKSVERLVEIKMKRSYFLALSVFSVLTPIASGYTSYLTGQASVQREFVQVRLETETLYVRKDQMKDVIDRLQKISDDVSEIKGYMRKGN
jgi:hypothetical protein